MTVSCRGWVTETEEFLCCWNIEGMVLPHWLLEEKWKEAKNHSEKTSLLILSPRPFPLLLKFGLTGWWMRSLHCGPRCPLVFLPPYPPPLPPSDTRWLQCTVLANDGWRDGSVAVIEQLCCSLICFHFHVFMSFAHLNIDVHNEKNQNFLTEGF